MPERPVLRTPACMVQGTGSDVGKSIIVAGLARAFTRRGLTVRPFKPQNMSNNAAVTVDGGEIGRAQALQALAARTEAVVDMNPVLLKPQSDTDAQVVVHGKVLGTAGAVDYQRRKVTLLPAVLESFTRLSAGVDLVLVEGAGSPAEINLRAGDIANMGFAEAAGVPVILAGDIDRGGVIAALAGTHLLLPPAETNLIKAFLINKFRGDINLFREGMRIISETTGWAPIGILPYVPEVALLPAEDSIHSANYRKADPGALQVVVPMVSRIANFDDLDPLASEPGVSINMIPPGTALPGDADLVILPGSKSTLSDMTFLRKQGWDIDIAAHVRRGGAVFGICAGYQMLGRSITDTAGVDGPTGHADGLGLLDIETSLTGDKSLRQVRGVHVASGHEISGYEMHVGTTSGPDCARPFVRLDGRADGAMSESGQISGCYVHGIFASDVFRHDYLKSIGADLTRSTDYQATVEGALNTLADQMEYSLDLDLILRIAEEGTG
jgi:adenosylcobyric acid synthase